MIESGLTEFIVNCFGNNQDFVELDLFTEHKGPFFFSQLRFSLLYWEGGLIKCTE